MMQPPALLEIRTIIDGATYVFDLLNGANGLYLDAWRPQTAGYKGGGVFQDSPIADGRGLVYRRYSTAVETFKLKLYALGQDGGIYEMQELRRLLEMAADYGASSWQTQPVYLVAQPRGATNEQYALIVGGRVPEDEAPFGTTFWQVHTHASTWESVTLVVERDHWLSNVPGSSAAVEISAVETYDEINYGNVDSDGDQEPTTNNDVFVANKRNTANITNHHLGTAGANRIGAVLPFTSVNAANGTATYFGIDTSVANSGPFCSLVFDIGTAGVGGPTLSWQYWTGSTWAALTVADGTSSFTNTGVRSVHWEQPSDWAAASPGGSLPAGYYVRIVVSTGSFSTAPTQQNRNVYTVTWPYVELQSTAVAGDIPALIKLYVTNRSGGGTAATAPLLSNNRVIAGLRSMSRGENFTAYLNLSDEQNPTGVTVAVVDSARSSIVAAGNAITGRQASYSWPDNHDFTDQFSITLSNAISQEFYGTYHLYLRVRGSGTDFANLAFRLRIEVAPNIVLHQSDGVSGVATVGNFHQLIDFGRVTIGAPVLGASDAAAAVAFYVEMSSVSGGSTSVAFLHDLILIPVDEWSMNTYDPAGNATSVRNTGISGPAERMEMDGLSPKALTRAFVRNTATSGITSLWRTITNGAPAVQANAHQRLWFLQSKYPYNSIEAEQTSPFMADSIQLFANQRYLGMRGSR